MKSRKYASAEPAMVTGAAPAMMASLITKRPAPDSSGKPCSGLPGGGTQRHAHPWPARNAARPCKAGFAAPSPGLSLSNAKKGSGQFFGPIQHHVMTARHREGVPALRFRAVVKHGEWGI